MHYKEATRTSSLHTKNFLATRDSRRTPLLALGDDLLAAWRGWRVWMLLALLDIKHKYRRSVLGPLWITISMGVLILGISLLYSKLFQLDLKLYLPYIALGDIVWIYISTTVQDGCTTFTAAENVIRSMRLPFMTFVMRVVTRSFIVFLHGALAYVPFAIYLKVTPEPIWLLAVPGVVLILITTIPLTALFGVLAARFRDLQPAIANMMQLGFFMTPIIWKAEMLGDARWFADFNPLYHFIQIVRQPLMGELPSFFSYGMVFVVMVLSFIAAGLVLLKSRHKISFWV